MANLTRQLDALRRLLVVLPVGILVLMGTGCASDDEASEPSTSIMPSPTLPTSSDEATSPGSSELLATTTSGSEANTTGIPSATGSTTSAKADTTLPGQAIDGFFKFGDLVAVMGVAHDDILNLREFPGTGASVVIAVDPTEESLVATGRARKLTTTIWYEVTADGVTGWANSSFLAFIGSTDDATAEFLDGTTLPQAETLVDLADLAAARFASEDPLFRVVESVAPTVGDLGEISYDVIGIGDDAVAGYRLHIFATPVESGEGFGLTSIERTTFCTRGVDGELCI